MATMKAAECKSAYCVPLNGPEAQIQTTPEHLPSSSPRSPAIRSHPKTERTHMPENRVEKMLDVQDKLKASIQKIKADPAAFAKDTRQQIMDAVKVMLMLLLSTQD